MPDPLLHLPSPAPRPTTRTGWYHIWELSRFTVSGVAVALVDFGLFFLLRQVVHFLVANLISVAVAIVVSFFLSKHWIFRNTNRQMARRQFTEFVALNGVLYVLQQVLLVAGVAWLAATPLPLPTDTVVKIGVVLALGSIKYVLSKVWVFSHRRET